MGVRNRSLVGRVLQLLKKEEKATVTDLDPKSRPN
jgi:hypothetical protein